MNQGFPCRFRSILQEKKTNNFLEFFDICVAAWTIRKKCLGQHKFFPKNLEDKKIIFPQS